MIHVDFRHCPNCGRTTDMHIVPFNSYLGPPYMTCRHCETVFLSGRTEWLDKGLLGKGWFVFMSTVYALMFAMSGGMAGVGLFEAWRDGPSKIDMMSLTEPTGWIALAIGFSCGGAPIAALQIWRLRCSIHRSREGGDHAPRTGFLNPDAALLYKAFFVFVTPVVVAGLMSFLVPR